jgi:hypothetical protein
MLKLDRLDSDELERFVGSLIWAEYTRRIDERVASYQRTCERRESKESEIRHAQGALEALRFVGTLPTLLRKEVLRSGAANPATGRTTRRVP